MKAPRVIRDEDIDRENPSGCTAILVIATIVVIIICGWLCIAGLVGGIVWGIGHVGS